jgi:glycosyltransferase involved in cell wall biosynthesis
MAAPLSGILRSINRDKNRPLNILFSLNHEAYQATLAKTGHNFYMVNHPRFHQWDKTEREMPSNIIPLGNGEIPHQLKTDIAFDLVLSQNRIDHYPIMVQLAKQLNCPLLQMEHTLNWPDWDDKTIERIGHLPCDHDIFATEFSVEAWFRDLNDPNITVIRHGMDTDFWNDWVGGDGKIMTAVWNYPQRNKICGFDLYKEVTKGLPTNAWGDSPGFSKMAKDTDHLRELYRHASVFLNTTLWSTTPFGLLEAMSVGCPIVTTATTAMPEFIKDGVNGFITNDPKIMRERLEELIADPELGKKIGDAGRETVLKQFGQQRFLDEWNKAFWKVAECPPGKWQ